MVLPSPAVPGVAGYPPERALRQGPSCGVIIVANELTTLMEDPHG
jgi:hypothetical protein